MMRLLLTLVVACTSVGCADDTGPPLVAGNVSIVRALPGTQTSAGYLELANHSRNTINITRVSSPEFASVEMHETIIENDVARMRPLANLSIAPGTTASFERGGRHLMLLRPYGTADYVTLQFYAGDLMLLSVRSSFEPAAD
jgi:copper(I)-binding protein